MGKCMRTGCLKDATVVPLLKVPAVGWPMAFHTPLTMFISLECCEEHFHDVNVLEVMTDEIREAMVKAIRAFRKTDPDFNRAELHPLPLDDPQYKEFRRQQSKG